MKKTISLLLLVCMLMAAFSGALAHSGRTDGNGGHKDNKNASGLGSYHYHCGGNPPHLHSSGCPYGGGSSGGGGNSGSGQSTTKATPKATARATTKPTVALAVIADPTEVPLSGPKLEDYDEDELAYGMTNNHGINIRTKATQKSERVGVIRKPGTPLIILETLTPSEAETWYMIYLSEDEYGYIRGDLIDLIEREDYDELMLDEAS